MSSNAAKEWSGTFKELREKRDKLKKLIQYNMQKHKENDQKEDVDQYQQERIEKTIETLNKAHDKVEAFLNDNEERIGTGKQLKEVKSNITDNESCKVKTSKGTIQGYNGVAAVDHLHQIIVGSYAFGEGQEHHVLKPVLRAVKESFYSLGISEDIYKAGVIVTADTGYANEDNMQYLYEEGIDAYIPDNQFRSRDPKFADQKEKYGKRNQDNINKNKQKKDIISSTEFNFNATTKSCICPEGNTMYLKHISEDNRGNLKMFFQGYLKDCRHCTKKDACMTNPDATTGRTGRGRQVSFIIDSKDKKKYTDWMKSRIDTDYGKYIYSHRMSTVEPVFANIGSCKGLNRFSLRGREKVEGQWRLYCIVHNIEKLMNYGNLGK